MSNDIIKYKDNIFKDLGLYAALLLCIMYLFIFKPWAEDLDIVNKSSLIMGVSFTIITLSAVFCYQAYDSLKPTNFENEFYNKLLVEGILDEIQFLYRCNVYIGISNIVILFAYNVLINSHLLNNTSLGILAVFPIFSTTYLLSAFINHMRTGMGLSKYNIEYKKIHSKPR